MMKDQVRVLAAVLAVGISGCGGGKNEQSAVAPEPTFQELLKTDLAGMKKLDSEVIGRFDRANDRIFTKIFGGADSAAVKNYLNTRIRYFLSEEEANNAFTLGSSMIGRLNSSSSEAVVGASNIGAQAWFIGLIKGAPVHFTYGGKTMLVDSSRIGVMQFGPGYSNSMKSGDGKSYVLPSAYRQSILVHEARHSDCTGGLTTADINVAKSSRNEDEFDQKFKARSCTHMHVRCPRGHDFEGLYACDNEGWGAYTVGAIYSGASLELEAPASIGWQIMRFQMMDNLSRALVSREGTTPDMSSTGVRTGSPSATTPAQDSIPEMPEMPTMPEMPPMPEFPSL